MLFGFIEELKHFNVEAIDAVINEMSGELTIDASFEAPVNGSATIVQPALQQSTKPDNPGQDHLKLEDLLRETIERMSRIGTKIERLLNRQ